jgi:hypothetical protein
VFLIHLFAFLLEMDASPAESEAAAAVDSTPSRWRRKRLNNRGVWNGGNRIPLR